MKPRWTRVTAGVAALLACSLPVPGAEPPPASPPADLPAEDVVISAMRQSPRLGAAVESVAEGQAQQRRWRAGPHEWELSTLAQRRRDVLGVERNEAEFGIGSGMRWPWKMRIDQRIGRAARATGELTYLDAWHEAGRDLLDLWFGWVAAEQGATLLAAQVEVLAQQHATVARRVAAGDAARVEEQLAESDLQRQRSALSLARRDAVIARQALASEFPALPLDLPTQPAAPQALPGEDNDWVQHILDHNHEIELAAALESQATLQAQRAAQDRLADPVLGLRYTENLGGERRVVGLQFTLPLGGAGRAAEADLARSAARRAASQTQQARNMVAAAAQSAVADARLSHAGWREQSEARSRLAAAAQATERGYALGEFGIAALLGARRDALAAEHELLAAQLRAQRAYARVLLDAHEIWVAPGHETHAP